MSRLTAGKRISVDPAQGVPRSRSAALRALLVGAILLLHGASGIASRAEGGLGDRYRDSEWGFTIRGPGGWETRPGAIAGVRVVFLGPAYEDFQANLNVVVRPDPIEVSPQIIALLARDLETRMQGSGERIFGYRVTRKRISPVAGVEAAYLEAVYSESRNGGTRAFRQLQVLVPGPEGHYVLTYTARKEAFEDHLPEIQAAVNSFTPAVSAGPPPASTFGFRGGTGIALAVLVGAIVIALAIRRRRRTGIP